MLIKAAVIGDPIEHSISPIIHGYWISKYNINGLYNKIRVLPNKLGKFMDNFLESDLAGFNVTIPHKEEILKYVDVKSLEVEKIGAANTIYKHAGKIYAKNTDIDGFKNNILSHIPDLDLSEKNIYVLGAGGAAKAIVYSLQNMGARKIHITNRDRNRAENFTDIFENISVIDWKNRNEFISETDFLVNTTSLGMKGQPELEIDLSPIKNQAIVTDIVYNPLKTNLLKSAENKGNKVITGLGMLIHQAIPGFEIWFKKRPKETEELEKLLIKEKNL